VLAALAAPYRLEVEHHGRRSLVEHRCSASVGVRIFGAADSLPEAAEALLDDADAAMYRAKEAGCNTVRHHGETV
jgi:GGDEF domain-containing protein